jgi:hypothetical protein
MKTTLLDAAAGLEAALDELARALLTFNPEPVLRAEETLATAVTAMTAVRRNDTGGSPAALREALGRVRLALDRCEALGRSAQDLAGAMMPQPAYGRRGMHLGADVAPRRRAEVA